MSNNLEYRQIESIAACASVDNSLAQNIAQISTDEIKTFLNRLNFYIQHFDILTRRNVSYAGDNKLVFLKKLKVVLADEIDNRRINI